MSDGRTLLERLVARQLVTYIDANCLLPSTPSGFRREYSTETVIIRVLSDLLDAVDRDDDLPCLFFSTSSRPSTLLTTKRLLVTLDVDNSALAWFRSYLAGRRQHVRCSGKCSALTDVIYGVPQGSVLGPILFLLYIADLASIVAEHGLSLQQYADDSQIYDSGQSDATSSRSNTVSLCVDNISNWMCSNHLQLNADITELMWCSSIRKLLQLPSCLFSVAGSLVCPVNAVRDLGVFIDNDLGAATHVRRTMSCCFTALRQLRRYVTDDCFRFLVVSLVHSRLDYGNFVLAGLPAYLQRRLQSVLNAAARLVFRLGRHDHFSDALATLHRLRLPQRFDFKVAVVAFRVLRGLSPPYLNDLVRVADLPDRRRLRSSSSHQLLVPSFRLTTVGRRTFPVAASLLWNSLLFDTQSTPSLPVFRQRFHNPSPT